MRFGGEVIEVSTFRAQAGDTGFDTEGEDEDSDVDHEIDHSGRILRDNVYGNREEDAFRRDFTANALYYDIADFSVVDYVGGVADLEARQMRFIGDPETRYREDPVRMLRAVRLATKLGFTIEPDTRRPIRGLAGLLADVPPARLFEEVLKLFLSPCALRCFEALVEEGLFEHLFPQTAECIATDAADREFISLALANTEKRIAEDQPVAPFFLFAAFLWPAVRRRWQSLVDKDMPPIPAMTMAGGEVVERQVTQVAIPRRFSTPMREMWQIQPRLERRRGKQPLRLLSHPRFRAAYDFLLLRAAVGEAPQELADWWTEFQESNQVVRDEMRSNAPTEEGSRRPRRRRRRRRG